MDASDETIKIMPNHLTLGELMSNTIALNLKVDAYTRKVLGVIKEKYALNDMGEALDKLAHTHGDEYVEHEASDEYVKKILAIEKDHFERHPKRRMTRKEMDELFGK